MIKLELFCHYYRSNVNRMLNTDYPSDSNKLRGTTMNDGQINQFPYENVFFICTSQQFHEKEGKITFKCDFKNQKVFKENECENQV